MRYSSVCARRSVVDCGLDTTSTPMPVCRVNSAAASRSSCRPREVGLSDMNRRRTGPGEVAGVGATEEPGLDEDHGQSQAESMQRALIAVNKIGHERRATTLTLLPRVHGPVRGNNRRSKNYSHPSGIEACMLLAVIGQLDPYYISEPAYSR